MKTCRHNILLRCGERGVVLIVSNLCNIPQCTYTMRNRDIADHVFEHTPN